MENNQDNKLGGFTLTNETPAAQTAPTQQPAFQEVPVVNTQPQPQPVEQTQPVANTFGATQPATATPVINTDFAALLADLEPVEPGAAGEYQKLPEGTHYVKFNSIKMSQTTSNEPMVFIEYEAVNGEYNGVRISEGFYLGAKNKFPKTTLGNIAHRAQVDFGVQGIK
ncbi:MAG: hypothetical protein ACK5MR_10205 [Cumulibacter sp.]